MEGQIIYTSYFVSVRTTLLVLIILIIIVEGLSFLQSIPHPTTLLVMILCTNMLLNTGSGAISRAIAVDAGERGRIPEHNRKTQQARR